MRRPKHCDTIGALLSRPADIYADLHGSKNYPTLQGKVEFYPLWGGTLVAAKVTGLPVPPDNSYGNSFHGFHIHAGSSCEKGNSQEEPFPMAGTHYNPQGLPHPDHAGDLPPLLSSDGIAIQIFFTNRFVPEELLGKTIILHAAPDDFTTQPSGNSGTMIGCGEIKSAWK